MKLSVDKIINLSINPSKNSERMELLTACPASKGLLILPLTIFGILLFMTNVDKAKKKARNILFNNKLLDYFLNVPNKNKFIFVGLRKTINMQTSTLGQAINRSSKSIFGIFWFIRCSILLTKNITV